MKGLLSTVRYLALKPELEITNPWFPGLLPFLRVDVLGLRVWSKTVEGKQRGNQWMHITRSGDTPSVFTPYSRTHIYIFEYACIYICMNICIYICIYIHIYLDTDFISQTAPAET